MRKEVNYEYEIMENTQYITTHEKYLRLSKTDLKVEDRKYMKLIE